MTPSLLEHARDMLHRAETKAAEYQRRANETRTREERDDLEGKARAYTDHAADLSEALDAVRRVTGGNRFLHPLLSVLAGPLAVLGVNHDA